jgi:acyl-coenzyme A thioesterase PaaI-like protein
LENGELAAIARPLQEHQSYPGRLHGGVAGALLDETIGRAIFIQDESVWGVTVELNLKYHKPIPLDEELKVLARITRNTRKLYEGAGEILLSNGDVAVSAFGKYIKIPLSQITETSGNDEEWMALRNGNDPAEIEI